MTKFENIAVFKIIFLTLQRTFGGISVPRLNGECYVKRGDLNIGLLQSSRDVGDDMLCSDDLHSKSALQYVDAVKFAIDEINDRDDLLPNITLGYVILDSCNKDLVALARSLYFIPDSEKGNMNVQSLDEEGIGLNCSENVQSLDVVGIVGPSTQGRIQDFP